MTGVGDVSRSGGGGNIHVSTNSIIPICRGEAMHQGAGAGEKIHVSINSSLYDGARRCVKERGGWENIHNR